MYFRDRVEHNHPNGTYKESETAFVEQLCFEGVLKEDAHFTCKMILIEWCMLLTISLDAELVPWKRQTLAMKLQSIKDIIPALKLALEARQDDMAVAGRELNAQEELFRWLEIRNDSFALSFLIDLGMSIGFRKKPRSDSWHIAGKAYLLAEMCKDIFLTQHPQATDEVPDFNDNPDDRGHDRDGDAAGDGGEHDEAAEPAGPPGVVAPQGGGDAAQQAGGARGGAEPAQAPGPEGVRHTTFIGNSREALALKICVHSVWATKYATETNWLLSSMLDQWLKEGMELYTYHTSNIFSAECFPGIAYTAQNTWIQDLASNAKLVPPKPPGQWTAVVNGPAALRKAWINHFSVVCVQRKAGAPQVLRRPLAEVSVSSSAQQREKRQRLLEATDTAPAATMAGPSGATSSATSGSESAGSIVNSGFSIQNRLSQMAEENRILLEQLTQREEAKQQRFLDTMVLSMDRMAERMTQSMTRTMLTFMHTNASSASSSFGSSGVLTPTASNVRRLPSPFD